MSPSICPPSRWRSSATPCSRWAAAGCSRAMRRQMHDSLRRLAALPAETRIYCGHEYTLANGRFALTVEPDNEALVRAGRGGGGGARRGEVTLPTTIALERATNPFMRASSVEEFAERRRGKGRFPRVNASASGTAETNMMIHKSRECLRAGCIAGGCEVAEEKDRVPGGAGQPRPGAGRAGTSRGPRPCVSLRDLGGNRRPATRSSSTAMGGAHLGQPSGRRLSHLEFDRTWSPARRPANCAAATSSPSSIRWPEAIWRLRPRRFHALRPRGLNHYAIPTCDVCAINLKARNGRKTWSAQHH